MELHNIQAIVAAVNAKKVKRQKNIFNKEKAQTKLYAFYQMVRRGKIKDDNEVALKLYRTNAKDKRYIMLRKNLGYDLLNSMISYDYSRRFSPYNAAILSSYKTFFAIQVLLFSMQRKTAKQLTRKLLDDITPYEITDMRIRCLRILYESAMLVADIESMDKYAAELDSARTLYQEELKAEEECLKVEAHFVNSTARRYEVAQSVFQYVQYLNSKDPALFSSNLLLSRFRMLSYAFQISNQFHEGLSVCLEAKGFLKSRPFINTNARQAEFSTTAINCLMKLKQYSLAREYGDECLNIYNKGGRNWYTVLSKMLLCSLHEQDYMRAMNIYQTAKSTAGITALIPFDQDKWAVYKAYLSLFLDDLIPKRSRKLRREFTIADLLQAIPEVSKDKAGLNIPVYVLHILYYIQTEEIIEVSQRIESLKKYAERHLNKVEHPRTLLFLKMLRRLKRFSYNIEKAEHVLQPDYEMLAIHPTQPEHFMESGEIMPYDLLWTWIIQKLKEE